LGETVKTIAKERVDEITKQTSEPAWLKDSRLKAFESYLKIPTPCNRDENWRRTEVDALDLSTLNVVVNDSKEKKAAKEPAVITAALANLGKNLPYSAKRRDRKRRQRIAFQRSNLLFVKDGAGSARRSVEQIPGSRELALPGFRAKRQVLLDESVAIQ
jgi:Fe-S cluster assembly scaffold protein SufB